MEYEVGDIVTCINGNSNVGGSGYLHNRTFKIRRHDNNVYWPKKDKSGLPETSGVFKNYLRPATIEEVEQYVKDNNCSIEEILEICKNLYPKGTNYKCLHAADSSPSNGIFRISSDVVRTNDGCKCCFWKGKFARLVKEQEELPFKVGDKFTHKSDITLVYTITDINEDYIHVTWPSDLKGHNINKHAAIEHFKNGNYLPVESKSQLKKEDFYNTKIDVSESKELNRLVQEKLFELGFKWAGGQKYYLQYTDKYLRICNDNSIIASNSSSYKEIYPQDLGININNKKQINNVNNKENISKNPGISKVQGFNQQISEPSRTRGIGLERTRSKISLGIINSPNKIGLG